MEEVICMKGYFITIEGTDGAGKTTQISLLEDYLKQRKIDFLLTREPGGTLISEKIREILLDISNQELCDSAEVLLYAASRAQHLQQKILPAVKEGKLVLCDRFVDSSIAYQAFGRGIDKEQVKAINQFATSGIEPDLTIYLDFPPQKGILRKQKEHLHEMDRMEQEKMEFHEKVYEGFQSLAQNYPQRIQKIDASKTIEEVQKEIQTQIEKLLERN